MKKNLNNVLYVKLNELPLTRQAIKERMANKWKVGPNLISDEQALAFKYVVGVYEGLIVGIHPVAAVGRCLSNNKKDAGRIMFQFSDDVTMKDLEACAKINESGDNGKMVGTGNDLNWTGTVAYGNV